MSTNSKIVAVLCGSVSALALTTSSSLADAALPAPLQPITLSCLNKTVAAATLTPPNGQPYYTQPDDLTQANVFCLNVIQVPGYRLNDIGGGHLDPVKALYFLADKNNKGIDIINTANLAFKARLSGFVGNVLANPTSINNNVSGPNGVTSFGNFVYGGDGGSKLQVFNTAKMKNWPGVNLPTQTFNTGGGAADRVNAVRVTPDGSLLLAINDVNDPPFATLFNSSAGTVDSLSPRSSSIRPFSPLGLASGLVVGLGMPRPARPLRRRAPADQRSAESRMQLRPERRHHRPGQRSHPGHRRGSPAPTTSPATARSW